MYRIFYSMVYKWYIFTLTYIIFVFVVSVFYFCKCRFHMYMLNLYVSNFFGAVSNLFFHHFQYIVFIWGYIEKQLIFVILSLSLAILLNFLSYFYECFVDYFEFLHINRLHVNKVGFIFSFLICILCRCFYSLISLDKSSKTEYPCLSLSLLYFFSLSFWRGGYFYCCYFSLCVFLQNEWLFSGPVLYLYIFIKLLT
jgi:hypothetical protein